MATYLLQRTLALVAGLLGVLVAGLVWLNVAALGEPPRTQQQIEAAHAFALDKPAVANTRYGLHVHDIEPLVDALDPSLRTRSGLTADAWQQRARRAEWQLRACGQDACAPLVDLLLAANADSANRAGAICQRWGANLGAALLETALGNTPEVHTQYDPATRETGIALDRLLREPAMLAALESPAVRDLLPDRQRLATSQDPVAMTLLVDGPEWLADPGIIALLLNPDARRDLANWGDSRRRRRHRAELLARQWWASFGEFPRPDDAAWLQQVRALGVVRTGDVDRAGQRVTAGDALTVPDALVGETTADCVSPLLDMRVRRQLLMPAAFDPEWVAVTRANRWKGVVEAAGLVRTPAEQNAMLTGDTRLSSYLHRVWPDTAAGRWWPDAGRTLDGQNVWNALTMRAPVSVVLGLLGLGLAAGLALMAGTWWALTSAHPRTRATARLISGGAFLLAAVPVLLPAALLVLGAGQLWPSFGTPAAAPANIDRLTSFGVLLHALRSVALPVLVLALSVFPLFLATIIHRVRGVMSSTHVMAARARGLDEREVIRRHALRPAFLAMTASIGRMVPLLLASLALVEWVCGIDGAGRFALQALLAADVGAVLGVVWLAGALSVTISFVFTVAAALLDPAQQFRRAAAGRQ